MTELAIVQRLSTAFIIPKSCMISMWKSYEAAAGIIEQFVRSGEIKSLYQVLIGINHPQELSHEGFILSQCLIHRFSCSFSTLTLPRWAQDGSVLSGRTCCSGRVSRRQNTLSSGSTRSAPRTGC